MLMSFAEFEREMIAERTRDKIAAARRRGKWTGGPVPLGYQVKDKKLVVDDLEAVVVRELFSLYEQHRSALAVARLLNEAGRTTKRHRAQNGNVRPGKRWSKDAVLRVLKNPIYAGYMPCGDELHEGEHDAIIDRDRYHRLRAILDARGGARQRRPRNPAYLLRGILRCAHCRKAMTPASTRKNGSDYRYYRCVTRDKKGRKACPGRPLPAEAIEAFVVERIREATADGGVVLRLTGAGFASEVAVLFGDAPAEVLAVREEAGAWLAEVRTPAHADAVVDVTLRNLDIVKQDRDGATLRRWSLSRSLPVRFVAGDRDNESVENVIESVTLTFDFC